MDNFLVIGEVFRRDEIDSTHFPVFHQVDAVRLVHNEKLFRNNPDLQIFEKTFKQETPQIVQSSETCIDQIKQPCHTVEAVKLIEHEMKAVLVSLVQSLFGKDLKYRWVSR